MAQGHEVTGDESGQCLDYGDDFTEHTYVKILHIVQLKYVQFTVN